MSISQFNKFFAIEFTLKSADRVLLINQLKICSAMCKMDKNSSATKTGTLQILKKEDLRLFCGIEGGQNEND